MSTKLQRIAWSLPLFGSIPLLVLAYFSISSNFPVLSRFALPARLWHSGRQQRLGVAKSLRSRFCSPLSAPRH